jgi:hypothetical protein
MIALQFGSGHRPCGVSAPAGTRAMRRRGLLLGAGFSFDLGMPLAGELTDVFLSLFDERKIRNLAALLSAQSPYTPDRPINQNAITAGLNLLIDYKKNNGSNYEALLAGLQTQSGLINPSQSDRDSYHFLFVTFYGIIHDILSLYQHASYEIIYAKNREWFGKMNNLLSEHETWMFTLNHDLYAECLALDFGIPITYGSDQKIIFPVSNLDLTRRIEFTFIEQKRIHTNDAPFFRNARGINLVKLHGGLSELEYKDQALLCNLRLDKASSQEFIDDFRLSSEMAYYHQGKRLGGGKDRTITNLTGALDIISASMLAGGKKYSETSKIKKGEEKLRLFDDVLRRLDELTIIGYGFRDEHINFRLSNALLLNDKLRVVIVDPVFGETPHCIKQFDYGLRIKRAACGAVQWLEYCKGEKWNYEQMNGLKENEKYRVEVRERVQSQLSRMSK